MISSGGSGGSSSSSAGIPGCTNLSYLSLFFLGILAISTIFLLSLLHSSHRGFSTEWGMEYGGSNAELFERRHSSINQALLELSRRLAASNAGNYNMPSAPWLSDCVAFYTRTDDEQEVLIRKSQRLHMRAQNRASTEHANLLNELKAHLVQTGDKFMPAIAKWLTPELDKINFKAKPVDLECTKHAFAIIEGRGTSDIIFIVRHTFFMLQSDAQRWGLVIFHGPDNGEFLVEQLEIYPGGAGQHIHLHMINETLIDRNLGNKAIVAPALWEHIPVENVLLLQTDGLMMKPPATNLTLWHSLTNDYVYVGAPFPYPEINPKPEFNGFGHHAHTPFGGNGGVSFRKKSAMLEISRSIKCTNPDSKIGDCFHDHNFPPTASRDFEYTDDEDRWIGRQLWKFQYRYKRRIPPFDMMRRFAVDMIYFPDPFFVHKYWQAELDHHLVGRDEILGLIAPVKTYYLNDE